MSPVRCCFDVSLTVDALVTERGAFIHLLTHRRCVPVASRTWWQRVWRHHRCETMSWQVFLEGAKLLTIAGCQTRTMESGPTVFHQHFCSKFRVWWAMCGWALSWSRPAPTRRNTGSLQCAQEECASLELQERPVFQMLPHIELPQLYSFCTYACDHMTVETGALYRVYQQHLKCQRIRRSNNRILSCFDPPIMSILKSDIFVTARFSP